jgi:acetoin utilization protein AcuB
MNVRRRMTPNPITARPQTTHRQAMQLMNENNISHLPVIDERGKVVGLVSKTDLLSTGPSRVTSLSIYELYTLLDQLTLEQIMTRPVLAVDENCNLTSAAHFMIQHDIGCLPVLREGELAGIITETDIFKTFVEVMGGGEPGSRVEIQVADKKGQLLRALELLYAAGSYIVSLTTFKDDSGAYTIASIKQRGAEEAALREGFAQADTIDLLEYRPTDADELIQLG